MIKKVEEGLDVLLASLPYAQFLVLSSVLGVLGFQLLFGLSYLVGLSAEFQAGRNVTLGLLSAMAFCAVYFGYRDEQQGDC